MVYQHKGAKDHLTIKALRLHKQSTTNKKNKQTTYAENLFAQLNAPEVRIAEEE